jgi:membrane protease YdiL (CAAX protease family)
MNPFESSLSFQEIFSKENRKPTIILLFCTLLLVTWRYYGSRTLFLAYFVSLIPFINSIAAMAAEWYNYLTALVLFGALSLLIIKYVFKEPFANYGIQIGDWKFWLPATGILGIIMIGMGYLSSKDPHFIAEYPLYKGAGASWQMFVLHSVGYLLFYIGWETFFRGLMQHALSPRFGVWGAILVQTAISCIVHIGKPTAEIYGAIFGALVWGILVYRSRSILPAILTHWMLGLSLDFFICFG